MAEVVARTNLKRDPNRMLYIKGGAVWSVPRKRPGHPKGKATKLVDLDIDIDYSRFIYFVDKNGNVARAKRNNR